MSSSTKLQFGITVDRDHTAGRYAAKHAIYLTKGAHRSN